MPTLIIDAPTVTPGTRRAIATRITRWFVDRGTDAAHVVVRFTEPAPATVFSGGFPVDALPAVGGVVHHASVACALSPTRDDAFRAELAEAIADALGPAAFLVIEFRPTPPSQVHILRDGRLTRADATTRQEKV